jgi:hypothetical protein
MDSSKHVHKQILKVKWLDSWSRILTYIWISTTKQQDKINNLRNFYFWFHICIPIITWRRDRLPPIYLLISIKSNKARRITNRWRQENQDRWMIWIYIAIVINRIMTHCFLLNDWLNTKEILLILSFRYLKIRIYWKMSIVFYSIYYVL